MKRYHGQKVQYFSYPSMFRSQPWRYLFHLLLFPVFLVGLFLFVRWWFASYSDRLVLTNDEVAYIKGVFNTSLTEVRLSDIRAVEVEQSFWGKLVDIGTVRIASAGSDGWEIDIAGLPSPGKVRRIINEGRHATGDSDD